MKSTRHKNSQKLVSRYFRRIGWLATIEHFLKGKKIDVLAQDVKTKFIIANEIELTPRHCLTNIARDLEVGCNRVAIICEKPSVLEAIRRKAKANLSRDVLNKVRFQLITEFIPPFNSGIYSATSEYE
jgi:hypothetical protein